MLTCPFKIYPTTCNAMYLYSHCLRTGYGCVRRTYKVSSSLTLHSVRPGAARIAWIAQRPLISAKIRLQYVSSAGSPTDRSLLTNFQKEPKLARARQIPEWEVYDGEIARLARRLAEEGIIRASAAAADVSDLANAASGKAPVAIDDTTEASAREVDEEGQTRHVKHEEL